MGHRTVLTIVTICCASLACGDDGVRGGEAPVVTDSAGVTLVQNLTARWGEARGWVISSEPALEIGSLDGSEAYQLFQVRGAVRLPEGAIAIANGGSSEIRFYNAAGEFTHAAGGEGGGPGEFQAISYFGRYGEDSLAAVDFRSRRMTLMNLEGEFARFVTIEPPPDFPFEIPIGVASGGRLVAAGTSFSPGAEPSMGVSKQSVVLHLYGTDGHVSDTLGEYPGLETYRGSGRLSFATIPFGRTTYFDVYGDRIAAGSSGEPAIRFLNLAGETEMIARLDHEPIEVTEEHRSVYRDQQVERLNAMQGRLPEEFREAQLKMLDEVPYAATLPVFRGVDFDRSGYLWVEVYTEPGEESRSFMILDSTGVYLGDLTLPPDHRPLEVGADYLLTHYTDDLDVEYVRMYSLERGQPREDE